MTVIVLRIRKFLVWAPFPFTPQLTDGNVWATQANIWHSSWSFNHISPTGAAFFSLVRVVSCDHFFSSKGERNTSHPHSKRCHQTHDSGSTFVEIFQYKFRTLWCSNCPFTYIYAYPLNRKVCRNDRFDEHRTVQGAQITALRRQLLIIVVGSYFSRGTMGYIHPQCTHGVRQWPKNGDYLSGWQSFKSTENFSFVWFFFFSGCKMQIWTGSHWKGAPLVSSIQNEKAFSCTVYFCCQIQIRGDDVTIS